MGLFPQYDVAIYSKTKLSQSDKDIAKRLYFILARIPRRIQRRPNLNRWAFFIRELLILIDFDRERIHKVLDWYEQHSQDQFTPVVYSADNFFTKFSQLEAAMKRASPIAMTPRAKRLAQRVSRLGWPKGFSEKLPGAIQESLDNYIFYRKQLNQVKPASFIRWMAEREVHSVSSFIIEWFEIQHHRVSLWPDWSGEVKSIMFHTHHRDFVKMFCDWCDGYSSDPRTTQRALAIVQQQR